MNLPLCFNQQANGVSSCAGAMHLRLRGLLAHLGAPPPAVLGLYMQLISSACVTVMSLVAKVRVQAQSLPQPRTTGRAAAAVPAHF